MDSKALELLSSVFDLLKETNVIQPPKDSPIIKFEQPDKLKSLLKISLENSTEGVDNEDIKNLCKTIIENCLKLNNRNVHSMIGGINYYGLVGQWIVTAMNAITTSYEFGSALTLVEIEVLKKIAKIFGYPEDCDGAINPGGSLSIMFGVVLARYYSFPNIKENGLHDLPRLVLFISEDGHYASSKISNWLGIGTKYLITVPTDSAGSMIPEKLKDAIEKVNENEMTPFCVIATVGTTITGAIDPIDQLADICQKYKLWLHVDACWGGALMFSKKYKGILKGIERADSLSWNPHKLLGAPLPCSIFLTRHKSLLLKCNSASAECLFAKEKLYDTSYDKGDESILCGKPCDSLKLWIMWKAYGDNGFEKMVDNAMDISQYLYNNLSNRPGFELAIKSKHFTNVCFYYIPTEMRNEERTEEWWIRLGKVAPKVKNQFIIDGKILIASDPLPLKNLRHFFRVVFTCHPTPTAEDADYILNKIEEYGENVKI